MDTHHAALHTASPSPSFQGRIFALGWGLLILLWFAPLGYRDLIHPDEGRYASIALEMLQSGDWLSPHLNGFLYFEKPILQYWMGALSFAVFGVNDFAARFWPAFMGFVAVGAVGLTAQRLWGARAGHYAAMVMASSTWVLGNSHFLSLDMGLSGFLTLALCGFLLAQHDAASPRQQRNGMWLTWAAMAGAMLSKGLVGLVIPGATLVLYSLLSRQWGFWRRMHWLSGLAIFFGLTAPWFVAVSLKNPDFFQFFFIREHFQRFLTNEAQRPGSMWYFVPILLAGFLPWTSFLPQLAWLGRHRQAGQTFQPLRVLLVWAGFVFVFFSVSRSKLPSYILPMFPALALLLAYQLDRLSAAHLKKHLLFPLLVWGGVLACVPFAGGYASAETPVAVVMGMAYKVGIGAGLFLLCGGMAWRALGQDNKPHGVAWMAVGSVLVLTLSMMGHDSFRALKSSRTLVAQLTPHLTPDTEVFSVRSYDQTFPFYLRHPVTLVAYVDEFAFGQQQDPTRALPTLESFVQRWQQLPHAAAMLTVADHQRFAQQGMAMQVVYQDVRRVVVVKPRTPLAPLTTQLN